MTLEEIAAKLETLPTKDDLDAGLTGLRVAIMGRMDDHANRLTAIRQDIGVNMGSINAVAAMGANASGEVRSLLAMITATQAALNRLRTEFDDFKGAA